MLAVSAAYNLAPPSRAKALLRRLDHAMVFVMIARTYTSFTLNALGPRFGTPLCAAVWALAAVGVGLRLACFQRVERASLALYLGMNGAKGGGISRPKKLIASLPDQRSRKPSTTMLLSS